MIAKSAPLHDVEYFRVRALQEQIAAANATSVKARNCHDELAMMYTSELRCFRHLPIAGLTPSLAPIRTKMSKTAERISTDRSAILIECRSTNEELAIARQVCGLLER